jgi:mutator protein MutT
MVTSVLTLTGFRYCPRCGRDGLAAADGKSVRCGGCGFRYFHNTASAAAAIIETPRGIVLVRRARQPAMGKLDLPGGFVDYGETAENALRRELREELGIEVADLAYVASFPNLYRYADVTYHTADLFFRCRCDKPQDMRASDELAGIEFRQPGEVKADEIAFESSRKVLAMVGVVAC